MYWCCVLYSLLWWSFLQSRSLLNFYAKWCDLMVNHDADRRLCQYLIKTVFWWHFPFFFLISLEFSEALYIHGSMSTEMEMTCLLCQLMWPNGQPWCGQRALPISDKSGLLMASCYDNSVVSIKPWIFVELSLLKCRWPRNLLAKWCDLLVNHDADRRLCQYLRQSVCWWHFPVLYLPLKLVWFGFLHVRFVVWGTGEIDTIRCAQVLTLRMWTSLPQYLLEGTPGSQLCSDNVFAHWWHNLKDIYNKEGFGNECLTTVTCLPFQLL